MRRRLRAKFPNSELTKGKATSLPNSRSLVGVPALFLVKKYITKKKENRPCSLGFSRWCLLTLDDDELNINPPTPCQ